MRSMNSTLTGTEMKFLRAYAAKNEVKLDRVLAALINDIQNKPIHPPKPKGHSPRQKALRRGDKWYTPDKPCKRCGTLAKRSVINGWCRGCQAAAKHNKVRSPAMAFRAAMPDMILSRADAVATGITIYRTGEVCKFGHRDYRYVSTGNCLSCRKSNKR